MERRSQCRVTPRGSRLCVSLLVPGEEPDHLERGAGVAEPRPGPRPQTLSPGPAGPGVPTAPPGHWPTWPAGNAGQDGLLHGQGAGWDQEAERVTSLSLAHSGLGVTSSHGLQAQCPQGCLQGISLTLGESGCPSRWSCYGGWTLGVKLSYSSAHQEPHCHSQGRR